MKNNTVTYSHDAQIPARNTPDVLVGTGNACRAYGQICNQVLGGGVVMGKTHSQ